jgi:hypothetical protein
MKIPAALGRLDWSKWFYGLVSAFIGGGAGAASAGVGANLVVPNLHAAQTLSIMGMTFLVTGISNGLSYLHQEPLPAVTTTEKTTSSVTATPAGIVTATKTSETTTVQKADPAQ